MRNLRYQLHVHLAWLGFGSIRTSLWIAPGRIDVQDLLDDLLPTTALDHVQAFHGTPTPPSSPERLLHSAWDLGALRAAHLEFAARWQTTDPPPAESLPQFLLLISDWGRLLRTDPGLPEAYVDQDWPADHSAQIFRRLESRLGPLAERQLEQLMLPNE
jgi:phenylacetic acid degradation operon negative regulatory protein